jgi:hypothetical protein
MLEGATGDDHEPAQHEALRKIVWQQSPRREFSVVCEKGASATTTGPRLSPAQGSSPRAPFAAIRERAPPRRRPPDRPGRGRRYRGAPRGECRADRRPSRPPPGSQRRARRRRARDRSAEYLSLAPAPWTPASSWSSPTGPEPALADSRDVDAEIGPACDGSSTPDQNDAPTRPRSRGPAGAIGSQPGGSGPVGANGNCRPSGREGGRRRRAPLDCRAGPADAPRNSGWKGRPWDSAAPSPCP